MKPYAEVPARLARQVVADLLLLVWVAVAVLCGRAVHAQAVASADGAAQLQQGGRSVSTHMKHAGDQLSKIPLVGDDIRTPFDKASHAGDQIAQAGADIVTGLDDLGTMLGLLVAGLLTLTGLVVWGAGRLPWIRRATRAARLRRHPAGTQALALQALAEGEVPPAARPTLAPAEEIEPSHDRPATGAAPEQAGLFLPQGAEATRALADARLRTLGLRPLPAET